MLDERVRAVMAELEARDRAERVQGLPTSVRLRSIDPTVGPFLSILVRATRSRRILEIGTSGAYSTLWLATAAREIEGRVVTLEIDPRKIATARSTLDRTGLTAEVAMVEGDARDFLRANSGPWDLVFLDSEKEDYIELFDLVFPSVAPGGLVVADNVLSHGDVLDAYAAHVRQVPGADTVTVPIARGVELTYRRAGARV